MDSESLPPRAQTVEEILASDTRSALSSLTPSLIRLYSILAPACLVVCATKRLRRLPPRTPFSAFVSDRFGRKWSILIGGRIVVGFGITMAHAAAPVLISELAHPRHRVLFGSLYNTSFYLGALTAGWVTFGSYRIAGSWAWRLPTMLQALPAVTQMIFVWFLDESPRWLCYKDRDDEAFSILVKHHGGGDPTNPLVVAEFHEMKVALQLKKQVKDPTGRKRLLILVTLAVFGQWSGNGLVSYYYLTKIFTSIGITSQRKQTMLNGVISTVNYATALFAAALSTRNGRRWMFVGGGIAMWLTFSSLTASIAVYNTKGTTAASQAALAFIFIFYAAFNICLNPLLFLFLHPTEILPFRLRAMDLSILVFANKAPSFFNQFVNPIGMDSLGWKYYLVYVVWLVVEVAVFYFLYPETRGHSLERMQEVFGEEVKDDGLDEKGSVMKDMRVIEHKE
ncbi:hypothetical protein BDP81DRAFT_462605 [Colletotrichum phormii]|uniref:Major facilitator superfamily (MFS) profile domain-containing protein n=1 Tax=Colletotrichum phormii TaxID=359342 RepID=A0AAJ0EFD1_9PEZI|nr:uncharacterized protein BDP81DRAFT_462605 [Colletotrichum phormii]KAK1634855.1 hypothetical protein BDP81DRAFT_462605 [Colletotrichum phormii]